MRAIVVALLLWSLAVRADASSDQLRAWNTTLRLPDGASTKLTVFGDNPDVLLPACRCVAGVWKLARGGESATHLSGTLRELSFNHTRAAKPALAVKIRKTRFLIGAPRKYRDELHAILRGSGALVLREVRGGEYEVVGFAPAALGDLFGTRPRWRADPEAKPSPPTPVIDRAADARALAKLINDYRASRHLPRIPISRALTKVAQAHVRDLGAHDLVTDRCNMHSWSDAGRWSACCYDESRAAARCMWAKPKEIAGYRAPGYEIAATASGISPAQALELWQHSPAHHAIVINEGKWSVPWAAMGVAIDGDYAVAWFGELRDSK